MFQRDIFIQEVIKKLETDKSIYFLSADFGAPALDILRNRFPKNFIHCGISEQAMLDIATGLALDGNNVFVYAMAPFLSLRAIEQAKCGPGLMKLPICLISVGVGLGYADAGPTHYSTEDFSCFRSIVGSSVYTPSDVSTTKLIAQEMLNNPKFSYVRLDREILPNHQSETTTKDYEKGYKIYGNIDEKKSIYISHGKMFHKCMELFLKEKDKFCCIDIFRSKPFPRQLAKDLASSKSIVVVDEQSPSGNLSSCVHEGLSKLNFFPKIISVSLPERYIFENGGRRYLLDKFGLSTNDLLKASKEITK